MRDARVKRRTSTDLTWTSFSFNNITQRTKRNRKKKKKKPPSSSSSLYFTYLTPIFLQITEKKRKKKKNLQRANTEEIDRDKPQILHYQPPYPILLCLQYFLNFSSFAIPSFFVNQFCWNIPQLSLSKPKALFSFLFLFFPFSLSPLKFVWFFIFWLSRPWELELIESEVNLFHQV